MRVTRAAGKRLGTCHSASLALTSTNAIRRRMRKHWDRLHYGAYAVGILGVWHYWWQVKQDIAEPLVYAVIVGLLLGLRLYWRTRGPRRQ